MIKSLTMAPQSDAIKCFSLIIGGAVLFVYIRAEVCQLLVLLLLGCYGLKFFTIITATRINIKGQGVLVTGCDTGIGHHAAVRLESLGFTVFAGCLNPDGEGATQLRSLMSDRMHVLQMDITQDEHVSRAVDYVAKYSKNKGRIVNVTSVRGRIAVPTDVCYTPTKWAGEAFSDILRREMHRFGVKVIIVEPGNFGGLTGMLNNENIELNVKCLSDSFEAALPQIRKSYGRDYVEALINGLKECGKTTHPTLRPVMDRLEHAVTSSRPQCRYLVQGSNKLLDWYCVVAFLNPYLPEELMDYILRVIDPLPPVAGGS